MSIERLERYAKAQSVLVDTEKSLGDDSEPITDRELSRFFLIRVLCEATRENMDSLDAEDKAKAQELLDSYDKVVALIEEKANDED